MKGKRACVSYSVEKNSYSLLTWKYLLVIYISFRKQPKSGQKCSSFHYDALLNIIFLLLRVYFCWWKYEIKTQVPSSYLKSESHLSCIHKHHEHFSNVSNSSSVHMKLRVGLLWFPFGTFFFFFFLNLIIYTCQGCQGQLSYISASN